MKALILAILLHPVPAPAADTDAVVAAVALAKQVRVQVSGDDYRPCVETVTSVKAIGGGLVVHIEEQEWIENGVQLCPCVYGVMATLAKNVKLRPIQVYGHAFREAEPWAQGDVDWSDTVGLSAYGWDDRIRDWQWVSWFEIRRKAPLFHVGTRRGSRVRLK
jgi:hypothetical protein